MRRTLITAVALTATLASGGADGDPAAPAVGSGRAIELGEAVAITLRQDPAVRRAVETVAERRAVLRRESGLFDSRFTVDSSYTFDQLELIGARLEQEINRRRNLEIISSALGLTAEGIRRGIRDRDGDRLLFQTDCSPEQDRIVVVTADSRIILCRNFQGEVVDIILLNGDSAAQLRELLEFFDDPLREALRDDLEARFLAELELIASTLQATSDILWIARERLGVTPDVIQFETLDLAFAHQLRFRNGTSFTSSLSFTSSEENFEGKPRNAPAFGDSTFPNIFTSVLGVNYTLPLGKGRGAVATAAPERAAEADLQAAAELLRHTASERALATVTAYWRLAAAQQRLEWLSRSQELQRELLDRLHDLLDQGQIIRSDLSRAKARTAEVLAEVAGARRAEVAARLDLAAAMGLSPSALEHAPRAGARLPAGEPGSGTAEDWIEAGLARRHDLRAAAAATRSSDILARASEANLRHRVDLSLNASYNALHDTFEHRLYEPDGFVEAWEGDIVGPSYGFGLRWAIPVRNRAARGRLVQAEAARSRRAILGSDLERSIRLRIVEIHDSLAEARRELDHLRETLRCQEQTLADSLRLHEAGRLSLIDTLLTEEQLTGAGLAVVGAELRVAEHEARLRFESGTLLAGETDAADPDPGRLRLAAASPVDGGAARRAAQGEARDPRLWSASP